MSSKKRNYFTFLLLTDENTRIRRFNLPHNLLRLVFIITALFIAITLIIIFGLLLTRQKLKDTVAEIERASEKINYEIISFENLEEKTKYVEIKTKILENYIRQVEDLDKLLRDITGKGG
jgi:hypothetical protein